MTLLRRWICAGIAAALCTTLFAAEPTYVHNGSLSVATLLDKQAVCKKHGLDVPAPSSSIQLYKMRYASADMNGKPAILSGLLMLPKLAPKGLIVYFHGTIRDRDLAPSRYDGFNKLLEPEFVMMAFATGGYAVAMPDGLGLGDNLGVHPYPCGDANCRCGIDVIDQARIVAKRTGVNIGNHLFITGYSEGGAVAMLTVRKLESESRKVDMAAPMSGPYDLSGVTAQSLLKGGQSPEGLGTKLFLLGYAAFSAANNLQGIDLKDYFAPSFATYIPYVFGLRLDDVGMAKKFVIKAVQMGALNSVDKVLTKAFKESIKWSDPSNPIIAEMIKSDCYDWAPHTKMLLPYLKGDGVVVEANTLEAIDSMRLHGVGTNLVRPYMIDDPKLSHSTAAPVAFSAVRRFFDGGFAAVELQR